MRRGPIMNILLVSANTERLNMTTLPLGLGCVAAAVRRAGHEVTCLDVQFEKDPRPAVEHAIKEIRPQAIGISVRNIDDQNMESPRFLLDQAKDVISWCRACSSAPVILGGAGYSIFPEAALSYLGADMGIRGEGEVVFPALLARLENGGDPFDLPGVHRAGGYAPATPVFEQDLDCLPMPDAGFWSVVNPRDPELWVPVQSRRGCPLGCSYCSTATIQGRTRRARSPQRVAEAIAGLLEQGFGRFCFVDNTFNLPPSYALQLCRQLKALGKNLVWRCILYPYEVEESLVAAMAEAGCVEVSIGFESGAPHILRWMNKRFQPEEVAQVSKMLAAHGIRRMGFLLLGGPGETEESVKESLDFAKSLELEMLKITVGIRIYPGTALAARAVQEGALRPDDDLLFPRFYLAPALDRAMVSANIMRMTVRKAQARDRD